MTFAARRGGRPGFQKRSRLIKRIPQGTGSEPVTSRIEFTIGCLSSPRRSRGAPGPPGGGILGLSSAGKHRLGAGQVDASKLDIQK
eukprot:6065504-Pyramimonas_sp.AAC.1